MIRRGKQYKYIINILSIEDRFQILKKSLGAHWKCIKISVICNCKLDSDLKAINVNAGNYIKTKDIKIGFMADDSDDSVEKLKKEDNHGFWYIDFTGVYCVFS